MPNVKVRPYARVLGLALVLPLLCLAQAGAQTVAIVGYNGATGDGYTIVAMEDIPGSTKIYFSDAEYDAANDVFTAGEGYWSFTTAAGGLTQGDVVTFVETGTSTNVLNLDCNNPPCGSFLNDSGGSISLASGSAEGVYAYSDSDADPTNGVTTIHAAVYSQGAFPANDNPTTGGDFPNAIVIDGFPATGDHRDFMDALRSGSVTQADLENPANYDLGAGNQVLSTVPFSNVPVELQRFSIE